MRLTTKGRYAVTAMLDLALHNQVGPVSLAAISVRQGISLSYLEQLFAKLRSEKLVCSLRGPGGGYSLARPVDEISISQIIICVEEDIDATKCRGEGNCDHGMVCLTHGLWSDLTRHMDEFLSGISLAELVAQPKINCVAVRQDARVGIDMDLETQIINLRNN